MENTIFSFPLSLSEISGVDKKALVGLEIIVIIYHYFVEKLLLLFSALFFVLHQPGQI